MHGHRAFNSILFYSSFYLDLWVKLCLCRVIRDFNMIALVFGVGAEEWRKYQRGNC